MKIKHLLIVGMMIVPMLMSAQVREGREKSELDEETKFGPYLTNSYADNWFIGINAGALYNAEGLLSWKLRNNLTPEVRAYVGKWIVPNWGFRIGYSGWVSRNKAVSLDWFQLHYVHADILWNWSNLFGGYKRERVYNAIPYVHGGLFIGKYGLDFGAGAGLLNDFRINDNWHLNLDLRATITHGKEVGTAGGGKALLGDLTFGVSYHFNKAYWDRPEKKASAPAVDYSALETNNKQLEEANASLSQDKVQLTKQIRDLQADNRTLRQAINNGERLIDTVYVEKVVEKVVNAGGSGSSSNTGNTRNLAGIDGSAPSTFYFNYGKKVLSQQEQAHFREFVEYVVDKDVNNKNHYVVTGYADQKTGSRKANVRMGELRAKYIRNLLIKAGVDADNIEIKVAKGVNLGETAVLSRAATIEVGK